MRQLIIKEYQETVALAPVNEELKRSLKTSERVPAFLARLERELIAVPKRLRTDANIRATVHDLTLLFLESIEKKNEERMMSEAARAALARTAERARRYDEMADGGEIDLEELMEVAPDETR